MKTDALLIIQIILIFMCFVSIFAYVNAVYKRTIKHFNNKFSKYIFIEALRYLKKLDPKDYIVYEKYEIWRYCIHF
ncbi:hypothetical protein [Clostridium sp. DJ247]|uniref:hypothetical protein n=1 Tax=Clostridium sp. DJ247 TaxID=2726188 RepID=UPI0016284C81|nr:hypothetical protein [Clostridium sp. DJ247]MBC2582274.1 hypothetical protein [Clostridium sp. DJ247]